MNLKGKKVVFVIASRGFRDEELLEPRAVLEAKGASVEVVSSAMGPALGMLGARVEPHRLYSAVKVSELDALVFVGGEGASEFWDDRTAHRLAREAVAAEKILGAICIAPSTLANAGLLEGRRVTAYPTRAAHLRSRGALVVTDPVVRDGRLVTASGPPAAKAFGEALALALASADPVAGKSPS